MRKCYTSCRLPTRWTARAESSVSSCHGWYGDGRYRDGTRSGTSTKRHDYACSGNCQGLSFAIGAVTVYRWAASGLTRFGLLLEAPTLPAAMMPEAICAKRHRSIASLQWSANLSSCLSRSRLLQPLNDMQPRLCFDDLRDLTRFESKGSLLKLGLHVSFPEKS